MSVTSPTEVLGAAPATRPTAGLVNRLRAAARRSAVAAAWSPAW